MPPPSTERRFVSRIVVPTILAGAIALILYLALNTGTTDDLEMETAATDFTELTQAYTPEKRAQEVTALESSLGELDQALDDADREQLSASELQAVEEQREAAAAQIEILKNAGNEDWPTALETAYAELNAYSKLLGETL